MRLTRALVVVAFLSFFVACSASLSAAIGVVPHGSTVAGQSLGQWTADWQRWELSIMRSNDALNDVTGAQAGANQSGPVFFLASPPVGKFISRTFDLPADKYVFFSIASWVTLGVTDPGFNNNAVEADMLLNTLDPINFNVTLDGLTLDTMEIATHLERSPVDYTATVAATSPIGFDAGTYNDVNTAGYFVMLDPLSPGRHTIAFAGSTNPFIGPGGLSVFQPEVFSLTDTVTAVPEPCALTVGLLVASLPRRRRRPLRVRSAG